MKVFVLIALALIGLGSYIFYNNSASKTTIEIVEQKTGKINSKASFIIFTNGTLRDFSEPKYHNRSEDVYITSENPTRINVKKTGITWDQFFKTLPSPMRLTKECLYTGTGQSFCTDKNRSLKFYLNGKLDNELLSREINNGDKALITYGNESESQIQTQLNLLE